MSRRNSGGIASDPQRIEAARIAAEGLADRFKWVEAALIVVGASKPAVWDHYIDSLGGIHSEASAVR